VGRGARGLGQKNPFLAQALSPSPES
jgi:hypothetical protein